MLGEPEVLAPDQGIDGVWQAVTQGMNGQEYKGWIDLSLPSETTSIVWSLLI